MSISNCWVEWNVVLIGGWLSVESEKKTTSRSRSFPQEVSSDQKRISQVEKWEEVEEISKLQWDLVASLKFVGWVAQVLKTEWRVTEPLQREAKAQEKTAKNSCSTPLPRASLLPVEILYDR